MSDSDVRPDSTEIPQPEDASIPMTADEVVATPMTVHHQHEESDPITESELKARPLSLGSVIMLGAGVIGIVSLVAVATAAWLNLSHKLDSADREFSLKMTGMEASLSAIRESINVDAGRIAVLERITTNVEMEGRSNRESIGKLANLVDQSREEATKNRETVIRSSVEIEALKGVIEKLTRKIDEFDVTMRAHLSSGNK